MLLPEVQAKLVAESLVPSGWTVVLGKLPASPDKVVALFETGGLTAQRGFGDTDVVDQPGMAIWVRGAADDYGTPRDIIEAIYQAMLTWGAFVSSGTRYLTMDPVQPPFPLTTDDNQRKVFAFNALVQKELS